MKKSVIILFMLATFVGCNSAEEKSVETVEQVIKEALEEVTEGDSYVSKIIAFQDEMNEHYADTAESPLLPEDLKKFVALDFFAIDPDFNVIADFKRIKSEPFEMPTTTDRKPIYEKYGEAYFTVNGKACTLSLYESHDSREDSIWKHYLFLPFNDLTNGEDSYGGGRFIDVLMPEDGKVNIDFNQAYNPYCAYSHLFSCPIPPKENFLDVEIIAGVMAWKEH